MYDVVKKLLFARQFQMEKGNINLMGLDVMIIPAPVMVDIIKTLEKTIGYEKTKKLIYEGVKSGTSFYAKKISEKYDIKGVKLIQWLVDTMMLTGWGEAKLISIDVEKKTAILHLYNSTLAKHYGKSKKPIDHVMAGAQAGGASIVFGKNAIVKETKCSSMGHDFCEFIYSTKNKNTKK